MADKRLDQTTNASAVAAADNIPFVTAAGVTSYVTGDELAASGPFSSRYVSKAGDGFQMSAGSFALANGSPSYSLVNLLQFGWSLDSSTDESVAGPVPVPSWWATFDVYVYWCNMGAGSGDVVWYIVHQSRGDGEAINSGAGNFQATVTAGAQFVMKRSKINTSALTRSADELLGFRVYRVGSSGSDTLANDAALIAVELVRVS